MAELVGTTAISLKDAFVSLWNSFVEVIPGLVAAIIIFLIGYIVAELLKKATIIVVEKAGLDKWVEERKLSGAIGKTKVSKIAGAMIKWYIIAVFLAQALILINLEVLSNFASLLANYIPIIAAAIVFIVLGLLFGKYIRNKIESTEYKYKKSIGAAIEIIVAYVAIVLALENMGLKVTILLDAFRIAFTVFAIVAAIVLGANFAMAYKKEIQDFARDLKKP